MRFLADMGISPRVVEHLLERESNAVHLYAEGLHRLSDHDIIAKARLEQRIILTHDLDFGDLMAASRAQLPSVIIFRLANMSAANVSHYLDVVLQEHVQALQAGSIVSVSEGGIRVRTLPLKRSG